MATPGSSKRPLELATSGGGGETLARPAYADRAGRPSAYDWAFEGPGYMYVTLTVDAVLLVVALVLADALNPADSYLPALLVSPLTVALLAGRRLYDPHAQISRLDRAAAIVGSTAAASLLVAAIVELARPSATDSGLIAIQFGLATVLLLTWRMACSNSPSACAATQSHRVRSGITGWSQVNGLGPGTSLADRAEYDNWYIQNWSLWLDFKILLMTIPTVFTRSE